MSVRLLAGRYELIEKIGDGGMAVVYKARCRLLNRFVAVKILKPEFTKDLKIIEGFRRESQAAASLAHPNIVNVFDVGREGNIHYIVMELIEGRVLSDVIAEDGPMDYRQALEIGRQMASALSLAHKNHIIHRDVKPHNILITPEGVAKITDFGIAKAMDATDMEASATAVMGSVHYFSPEQARGGYVDERSDLYSLGIVLYEMITGKVPFDGDDAVSVALMHINEELPPPSQLVTGLPAAVENIIVKATSKYSINRYASAEEMLEAIKDADIVANIVGAPENPGQQSPKEENASSGEKTEEGKDQGMKKGKAGENEQRNGKARKGIRINRVKILAALAALILAIPASGLLMSGASLLKGSGEVQVPDVRKMSMEEARAELEKVGLTLQEGDRVIDYDLEEGLIVSQDPLPDTTVKKGWPVTVSISKGAGVDTVPNLVGKPFQDAVYLLQRYGYVQGAVTAEASEMPKDVVIRQSPESGTTAKSGKAIDMVVSSGPRLTVPPLVGMTLEQARAALAEAGLEVGEIGYDMSQVYAEGIVIWQQELDSSIKPGARVNLKLSTGNQPAGSKSIALDVDYSGAENQVFYLTVTVTDETGTHNVISREQRIKDNGGEILSLSGTGVGTVTVIFDDTVVMQKTVDFDTGTLE